MGRQGVLLMVGALAVAAVGRAAAQKEPAQPRSIKIRWTVVKKVTPASQSFTVDRPTGRDGEKPTVTETVVLTSKTTEFVRSGRDGEAPPPPGNFKDVVVGARVYILGTLGVDGRVKADRVQITPPRGGREGDRPAEEKPRGDREKL